jgi:hypothetical protein
MGAAEIGEADRLSADTSSGCKHVVVGDAANTAITSRADATIVMTKR